MFNHRILKASIVTLALAFVSASSFSQGFTMSEAEDLGFSKERLQRIDPVMTGYIERGEFPGAIVAVSRNGKLVYANTFGFQDVEKKEPLKYDSIFRAYSMSKPITGAAAMILFEEGGFMLDDPVSKYIPAFKNVKVYQQEQLDREMTVRDLMRHTSGVGYGWGSDPVSKKYQELDVFKPERTLGEMVDQLATLPLYYQPGTQWQYSASIDVLGRVIEVVSGQTLEEFMTQRIFNPLGMKDTGFFVPPEKAHRFTNCYQYTSEKGLTPLAKEGAYDRYDRTKNHLFSGGGGLVSTAPDYMRFAQMLANGGEIDNVRILAPKTVELMGMNHLPDAIGELPWGKLKGHGYGLTVSVLTDLSKSPTTGSVGDFGWDGAASTFVRVDPTEKIAVLLMTHRMPCDDAIQIKLKTLVYQAFIK